MEDGAKLFIRPCTGHSSRCSGRRVIMPMAMKYIIIIIVTFT